MNDDQAGSFRSDLPPFAGLRAFEAVFRTGGIRRAGVSLGIDHAVVSRHLRRLEDWVGRPLFLRKDGRLQLTEAGARLHSRVSGALLELSSAVQDAKGQGREVPLRLTCIPGLSIQWLSTELAAFERRHPEARVELRPVELAPDLLAREADVDIRYHRDGEPPPSAVRGIKSMELARPPVAPVASPAIARQLLAGGLDGLMEAPLLHETDRSEWRAWLILNGVEIADELPGPLCWHAHLAIAAARLGRGVALANPFLVRSELARGELVTLAFPGARMAALGAYQISGREDRWSTPTFQALRRALVPRAQAWMKETAAEFGFGQ